MSTPYDRLRQLKLETGINLKDLLVLAAQNDPFNAGSESDLVRGEWFAEIWRNHGSHSGVHLRRLHYWMVVQGDYAKPDGTTYINTERDWKFLGDASKDARALDLVSADAFIDRRNPEPVLMPWDRVDDAKGVPQIALYDPPSFSLPTITAANWTVYCGIPTPDVLGYDRDDRLDRPYIVEIWIEKSTMNDILVPLCEELEINSATAIGVQSISNAVKLLQRCAELSKPARVFYISDFDPKGSEMPFSVSRHLEFYRDKYAPEANIKLTPLVLTAAQAEGLPRMPIKETDNSRGRFEEQFGEGAVELDALEAIRPGEFEQIIRDAVAPYLDRDIGRALRDSEREANTIARQEWTEEVADIQEQIDDIAEEAKVIAEKYRKRFEKLSAALNAEMQPLRERIKPLQEELALRAEQFNPELPPRPEPQPAVDDDDEADWLFDSSRGYLEQLEHYKARKGRVLP